MWKKVEQLAEKDMKDGVIHGMAVVRGTLGGWQEDHAVGYADAEHKYPMTADTIMDIASVTKVAATVTALLVLHHRGKVDFDAPFTEYLPEYRGFLGSPVTVRMLANHRSGFTDVPLQVRRLYFDESGATMLEKVLTTPPPFGPTLLSSYACWNYILLALMVEHVTGRRFDEFCQEEIFDPLKMTSSSLGRPVEASVERLGRTMCTERAGEISDFVAKRIYAAGRCTGNAGLFTTGHDLGRLMCCYLRHGSLEDGGCLFGEDEFAEIAPDRACAWDGYRRFGWLIYEPGLPDALFGHCLFHSGWSGQTVLMDVSKGVFMAVLTTRCGDYDRAKESRFKVIRWLSGVN